MCKKIDDFLCSIYKPQGVERRISMGNDVKLGSSRTVKGRIMLMSLVMTLAAIINVVINLIAQSNQTTENIGNTLRANLAGTAHLTQNGVNNLVILVGDHAHDYEFKNGTDEQKIAHAKEIMSFDENIQELIFVDAAGASVGGEIPADIKTRLGSSNYVVASPDNSADSFYIAVKTAEGNTLCAKMNTAKLTGILTGIDNDAFLLASDGTVIASSGAAGNTKYADFVQTTGDGAIFTNVSGDSGNCYAAKKLDNSDGWTVLVRCAKSGFDGGFNTALRLSIGTIIVMIALGLGANYFFGKTVTKPLGKIKKKIIDMSNGVLSGAPVDHKADDELGVLSDAVNKMADYNNTIISDIKYTAEEIAAENLCVKPHGEYCGDFVPVKEALEKIVESIRSVIENIEEAGRQVSSGSEEMSRNSAVLSTAAEEQSTTVSQLNDRLNAVYDEISNNAKIACEQASGTAKECMELVNEGNVKMGNMLDAMNEINGTSAQIANIIKTIQDISEQTNILSINASIEAARVGAAGKGFAVVAGEVGKLAEKTAQAAKSTTKLIKSSIQSVKNGTVIANETAEMLGKIVEKTDATAKVVEDIADASAKQAESVKDVLSGMNIISSEVNQVSNSAKECADSSEELATQAVMLHNTVDRFVINESKAAKKAAEKPAPKPAAPAKPAEIHLDDSEKKAKKPAAAAPKKAAPVKSAEKPVSVAPAKPASINLDDNEEKKAKPAAKSTPVKPASAKQEPVKPAPKPTIKLDEEPTAVAAKSGTAPVSKATMQPVKRTINMDNNKY